MKISKNLLLLAALLFAASTAQGATRRVKTDALVVALTFDDGPAPVYTEQILKVLDEHKIQATFFLIGKQIETHPQIARQIIAANHEVGGHSYDWSSLAFKSRQHVINQLDKMDEAFTQIGITNIALFRAPNGVFLPWQNSILTSRKLQHITADVIAGDWKKLTRDEIRNRVLKKVRPGSIIVLHDGGGDRTATVEALPQIIDALRAKGYSFLTVSDLLSKATKDANQNKQGQNNGIYPWG